MASLARRQQRRVPRGRRRGWGTPRPTMSSSPGTSSRSPLPVEWAMAEASDDEDDAPMPDAPPEPELIAASSGVCTSDVELGALHRSAPRDAES